MIKSNAATDSRLNIDQTMAGHGDTPRVAWCVMHANECRLLDPSPPPLRRMAGPLLDAAPGESLEARERRVVHQREGHDTWLTWSTVVASSAITASRSIGASAAALVDHDRLALSIDLSLRWA